MTHVTQASDAFSDLRMLQADFLTMLPEPDVETAEDSYLMAARVAADLRLHIVELRAVTRLVMLRRRLGHSHDGIEELAAVYSTFTEGFEEHHLVVARELPG